MGTWLAWGTATFARRLRREPAVREPRTLALLDDCRAVVGTNAPLKLVETDQVDSPALFGFRRLILLPPAGTIRCLKPSELRHVFLHELAHMRRGDMLLNWLTTFLQALHWFNPVIWFAFARMRADREMACDAMALDRGGSIDRSAYGATILKLVSGLNSTPPAPGLVGATPAFLRASDGDTIRAIQSSSTKSSSTRTQSFLKGCFQPRAGCIRLRGPA
jgi:bla regulator protein blaR1